MAVTYATSLKTTRLNAVVNTIGNTTPATVSTTGGSQGKLVIGTSTLAGTTGVLASITLNTTPATVSGAVLTLSGTPLSATASGGGTAALAEIRNSADTVIVSGLTVGTTSSDIIINSTSISTGQTVQVTSGTITHG